MFSRFAPPLERIYHGERVSFLILNRFDVETTAPAVPYLVISVTDAERPDAVIAELPNRRAVLRLKFHDKGGRRPLAAGKVAMSKDDAQAILAFVRAHGSWRSGSGRKGCMKDAGGIRPWLRYVCIVASFLAALAVTPARGQGQTQRSQKVQIGNFLVSAPGGIAFVVDNAAAFVLDTGAPYYAGTAAPDDSFHHLQFTAQGANIQFDWGRVGDAAVARLTSDKKVNLPLHLGSGWPGWVSRYTPAPDGVMGRAQALDHSLTWQMRTSPSPVQREGTEVVVPVGPEAPLRFVAGLIVEGQEKLPEIGQVDALLGQAQKRYEARRPAATGEWGDFVGAIADNMNNSRIYSSDNHVLAHSVGRRWANGNPNNDPYFCWDSFLTADLACLDDPQTARETVRAILSWQTPEGLVPNFGHWSYGGSRASKDRSQPPDGALCVWKMHQRWPDQAFLAEVYPKLVKWHEWWPKARDGNHDGLLEWGSSSGDWQNAQYETGWDDNLHFAGTKMVGTAMNADAVDLNALWSLDAEYLARIAEALGHKQEAAAFRAEQEAMNKCINDRLWNEKLGVYCSRLWSGEKLVPVPPSAFGMGFEAVFYGDETLGTEAARRHDREISFDWNESSPVAGVPGDGWSARWTGTFTPPASGKYRFRAAADDGVRVFVGGKKVIDDWIVQVASEHEANVDLPAGTPVPLIVEYFQAAGGSSLHFSVASVQPADPNSAFLTRLTPMNFYPLMAGVPDPARAKRVLAALTDPHKFWGTWLLPTLAYNDPDYHQQQYWRGDVWGPVNYFVFQGVQRCASPAQQTEFARKSVTLFMKNWTGRNICGENYDSTDGIQRSSDPHYTWGALLALIGLENACDITPDGMIRLNGAQTQTLSLTNIPLAGKLYDIRTQPGQAALLLNGKVLLTAKNQIAQMRLLPERGERHTRKP